MPTNPGRWVQFTTSLPLPMGIGVDEVNAITEVDADGAGAKQGLQVGDELLWLDGIEVRDGLVSIVEALDREVVNHVVVLRRVDEIRPAAQQPDVGFAHEIGPVELQLPMVRVRVRVRVRVVGLISISVRLAHTLTLTLTLTLTRRSCARVASTPTWWCRCPMSRSA